MNPRVSKTNNGKTMILSKLNDKNPKVKVGDHDRISKYKNIFARR